jgi:hypothetical protein
MTEKSRELRQLLLLTSRAGELADRVAAGELRLVDAVDVAHDAAVASGLTDAVGPDIVQAVLAGCFAHVRGRL